MEKLVVSSVRPEENESEGKRCGNCGSKLNEENKSKRIDNYCQECEKSIRAFLTAKQKKLKFFQG